MAWLITGGAGYIGAHVVRDMIASGRDVVVLDDLSTGRADRLPAGVPLVRGQVGSRRVVRRALREHDISAVMHLAARTDVDESLARPLYHWSQNVGGLQVLLEEMLEAGIGQMVFTSSAAVYGDPGVPAPANPTMRPGSRGAWGRLAETAPCAPCTPHGATKLAGEWLVAAAARAHGWHALSLRCFEVAGAGSPGLADPVVRALVPMLLEALAEGSRPRVHGAGHPTADGSYVRDYVHVADVSAAHVAAARVVESAHASAHGLPEPAAAVRSASERVHHAAVRAEVAAARLPGGTRAVEVATHVPAAAEAAAEVAGQAAARAAARVPAAARAVELAALRLPGAARAGAATASVRDQAAEIVAEVATQLGSLVARVAGGEPPPLADHMAINIGTGRGCSALEVVDALRTSLGEPFDVEIVGPRPGDPAQLVAAVDVAAHVLGWRARRSLSEMTDSTVAAWLGRGAASAR